jgi:NTE family protein
VGVIAHILEEVGRDLGRDVPLDVMCGTSVGAINVCGLAAWADEPGPARAARLVRHWTELRIDQIVRPDGREVLALLGTLVGRGLAPWRRGGILDPAGLMRLLHAAVPFSRIGEHLRAGRVHAVSVSTTHVASGKTVVFVQRAEPGLPPWSRDPTVVPRPVALGMSHALASAAIPLLFPPVRIDGDFHCDGGLRQNVPFSPARRLGADRLLVVTPRALGTGQTLGDRLAPNAPPTPLFLLGKTLNALLLDRLDGDLDRLERVNEILEAGTRLYGPRFVADLNRELGRDPGREVRPLEVQVIRASRDIGALAAEFARSDELGRRAHGVVGRVLRKLSEGERENDLLSYLLFDGDFARILIELGRADARARHAELCRFFADALGTTAAVA